MTQHDVADLLRPPVRRMRLLFPIHLWIYVAFLLAVLVVDVLNIVGYRLNPVLLAVQGAATVVTVAFLFYTGLALRDAYAVERGDEDLVSVVRRRLRFFEMRYGAWLWVATFSVPLASWAVSSLIDNVNGQYPVNRPSVFVATLVGQTVCVYVALRLVHQPFLAESRAVLHDLENRVLEATLALAERRARWRRIQIACVVVAVILLALGLAVAVWRGWS